MVAALFSLFIQQERMDEAIKNKVQNWLAEGASTSQGVRLMQEANASSLVLRLIRSNPSANRQVMIAYLCRLYGIETNYKVNAYTEIVLTRKSESFRDEFPYLNDPACPAELETLASRKFAKYHGYVALHKQLRNCTSLKECAHISRQLIDNYLENREIWEELNYYKEHKALLGKHTVFREFARRKELLAMPVKELMSRKDKIENNIWRVKNEIKKKDKPHLDALRTERLVSYETELAEVNRLLG
ncbi:hypothetical protein EZS27_026298 [termite gut metagenome]|uniref:Uncharacterized protein n=1 Tax=termite gut metagenome TaxID=433724 RepID=A0A5J4QT37_9ZZZZ